MEKVHQLKYLGGSNKLRNFGYWNTTEIIKLMQFCKCESLQVIQNVNIKCQVFKSDSTNPVIWLWIMGSVLEINQEIRKFQKAIPTKYIQDNIVWAREEEKCKPIEDLIIKSPNRWVRSNSNNARI